MDELRHSVQNASYEQKDPLVIYKLEAYELWKKMLQEMNTRSVTSLLLGKVALPDFEEAKAAMQKRMEEARAKAEEQRQLRRGTANVTAANYSSFSSTASFSAMNGNNPYSAQQRAAQQAAREEEQQHEAQRRAAMNAGRAAASTPQPAKAKQKVGRNDPCPCGSGKKYKNCHGRGV
jgi:preprotein translocase subunit SecA